jgi:hypothetical protein
VLDWLAMMRFLESRISSSTVFSLVLAGRFLFAVVIFSALSISDFLLVIGAALHDLGGSLIGCSTTVCCGSGGMPSLVGLRVLWTDEA